MLQFASPQLLNVLIAFVEDSSQPDWKGYLYAALLAVVALASAICDSRYWLGVERVGLRLRTSISGAVYRKSLRLSNTSRKTQSGISFMNNESTMSLQHVEVLSTVRKLYF